LQSTNEELDTGKEELQSTNEELNTLNAELHSRNDELSRLNSDLINLFSSVQLAVVMVDRRLCIRRFTPPAEKLFNLIAADIGRPMQHIKPNVVSPNLEQTILNVIEHVTPLEQEVQDVNGRWYLLRVRPYCSVDNRIEGAVIALVDIDAVKRREMQSEEARREVLAILQSIHEGLVVLDDKFCVQMINDAFCRMFAVDSHKAAGKPLFDLADGVWHVPRVRSLLESALQNDKPSGDVELEHEFPRVGRKKLILSAHRFESRDGDPRLALLAIREA
jgi:two-component system CheB/CheR fusion protein